MRNAEKSCMASKLYFCHISIPHSMAGDNSTFRDVSSTTAVGKSVVVFNKPCKLGQEYFPIPYSL